MSTRSRVRSPPSVSRIFFVALNLFASNTEHRRTASASIVVFEPLIGDLMKTINLDLFPGRTLSLLFYKNIRNAPSLKEKVLSDQLPAAIIDPAYVMNSCFSGPHIFRLWTNFRLSVLRFEHCNEMCLGNGSPTQFMQSSCSLFPAQVMYGSSLSRRSQSK